MLPSFIIIGAMKGGTTALYYYLASHPDIEPSSMKETNFFTKHYSKGMNWYSSLFENDRKYAFEASPTYTKRQKFPETPKRIHSALPDVKLIYLLRDPIDRIISQYTHNYAQGRESRSLSEVISAGNERYIQLSRYYYQLENYLAYFDRSQLLLVESERLRENPHKTMAEIAEFLDISPDFDSNTVSKQIHESSDKTRATYFERKLVKKIRNRRLRSRLKNMARPFRRSFDPPVLTDGDRTTLEEIFASDVEKLREYSGMKFSSWSL